MSIESSYHVTAKQMDMEQQQVKAAQADPARFAPIYERYYEPIFHFIDQRLDDRELAFDLAQQTFIKALENLHKYQFKGVPFGSWLYRIARNELYSVFRKQKTTRTVNMESADVKEVVEEALEGGQYEESLFEVYRNGLMEVLRGLDEEDLQLIEMRFFEKRAFREIGEIMNITENNAKTRSYRILARMKKSLLKNSES